MKSKFPFIAVMVFLMFGSNQFLTAQNTTVTKTRILFLLDGSGSMWGVWQKEQKIAAAKRLLTHLVDSLGDIPNVQLALRAFGNRSPKTMQDCKDTRLEVPFGEHNKEQIIAKLKEIVPKGTTPISYSLSMAATDFPPDRTGRNIIILITDGIEECGGDPCAVSMALQKKGIFLKPFIIGLGIDQNLTEKLDCVGNFFNAKDEKSFEKLLTIVISSALNSTTCQVNLLDEFGKPTETDVNISFYDMSNKMLKYSFYHTLNGAGVPDTLFIDALPTYSIIVHTIPIIKKDSVKLRPGIHNIIAIPASQGSLNLKISGITNYARLQAIIRISGSDKTINVQDVNTTQQYLTGKYDVEILTLPRIILRNIEIKQSYTTTLEIPQPGKLTVISSQAMVGGIYQIKDNKLDWIYELNENSRSESIVIQPGTYYIYFRRKNALTTNITSETPFTITSGGSTSAVLK